MKIITKKYLYWAASLLFIIGIALSIYSLLGGYDKIEIAQSTNNVYSVVGKWVEGERMHQVERETFNEMRDLVINEKFKGELCMIDYPSDTLGENEIKRFIGVLLDGEEVTAIPSGFTVLEISTRRSYKTALAMHPLVMPNSEKIDQALRSYAKENFGDSLQSLSMEIYYPDNSVLIEKFAVEE
ncbi:hypothetical protein [Reichenbachiella ulvae]|uniref:GyrI-like small molecule binding domain-containing protein n=1 Tax=Reichenbachiella ulvae TaxID=2980104 RepID=A0ABT3CYF2_9BACT|nr:hypothetical protein [Reichenbachiella ulvae]MCV9388728.1 hypothetical protein [Reichenbachiella ulvae]